MSNQITRKEAVQDLEKLIEILKNQINKSDEELRRWSFCGVSPEEQRIFWRKSIAKKREEIKYLLRIRK